MSFILCLLISFFSVIGVCASAAEIFKTFLIPVPDITIRVKNCENDIEYTLRSLLMQYPKSTISVEDAGSTDATKEIALRLAATHKRIQVK